MTLTMSEVMATLAALITVMAAMAAVFRYIVGAEIARAISDDREEHRQWINGSFMRASVVEAKLDALGERLDLIEDRLNSGGS